MIEEFWQSLLSQFQQQSIAELIAVILAIAYVWLAAKQNIWCWPCALVSTGIYIWIFWEESLPFNSVLNVYYLVMAIYGWSKWRQIENGKEFQIVSKSVTFHLVAILLLFAAGTLLVKLVAFSYQGLYLYLDAMVTVFSVFTTVLVAHKVLENWLYWIFINSFAAYLYLANNLLLTGILFIAYVGFAFYGYFSWRNAMKRQIYAL